MSAFNLPRTPTLQISVVLLHRSLEITSVINCFTPLAEYNQHLSHYRSEVYCFTVRAGAICSIVDNTILRVDKEPVRHDKLGTHKWMTSGDLSPTY